MNNFYHIIVTIGASLPLTFFPISYKGQITGDPKECTKLNDWCYLAFLLFKMTMCHLCCFWDAMLQWNFTCMDSYASPGLDGVTYLILKYGSLCLLHRLWLLFQSVLTSLSQNSEKLSVLFTLFKKKERKKKFTVYSLSIKIQSTSQLKEPCIREMLKNSWNSYNLILTFTI